MPCSDGGPPPSTYNNTEKLSKELEQIEVLLCSACRALANENFDFDINPQLSQWWDQHLKKDEARRRRELADRLEREKAEAVSQKKFVDLTKDELKLLKKHGYLG